MLIRLMLADDHPINAGRIGAAFHLEEDFQVLGRCTRGEEVVSKLLKTSRT
jgi:DNA-binding NarL/FixJ family response regulator